MVSESTGSPSCFSGAVSGAAGFTGEPGAGFGAHVFVNAEEALAEDADVVIAVDDLERVCQQAKQAGLSVERFEHRVNLASPDSELRIQFQTDSRYQEFIPRAEVHEVLGYQIRVAALEDVLQGKVWAYSDETRRRSKRQKDITDILRLVETYPDLRRLLPESLRHQIE